MPIYLKANDITALYIGSCDLKTQQRALNSLESGLPLKPTENTFSNVTRCYLAYPAK